MAKEKVKHFSYPAALIFMALIPGGMYLYSKTRGWLE